MEKNITSYTPFKGVYSFNKDRDLLNQGSDLVRFVQFMFEEIFEAMGAEKSAKRLSKYYTVMLMEEHLDDKASHNNMDMDVIEKRLNKLRKRASAIKNENKAEYFKRLKNSIHDLEYYAQGEEMKAIVEENNFKIDENEIISNMIENRMLVDAANNRKGKKTDKFGQIVKDKDFVEPEVK